MTLCRLIVIGFASCALTLAARAETSPSQTASNAPNPLVWDALEKKIDLPAMTNLAHFTFWVTNTSTADATISAVEAECDCTVVEARKDLPWEIAPGTGGPLNVRVNTRGRFGALSKTVTVFTSHGTQVLTVSMKIPLTPAPSNISPRQRDLLAAKADRQAVFRGDCVACHVTPADSLTGAALFDKACGICHMAEYRAEIVPDLVLLPQVTDANYWRTWITYGKAGTVMPAFAKSEGGIWDPNQIESLVEYLVKAFPSSSSATARRPLPTDKLPAPDSPKNATLVAPPENK